MKWLLFIVSFVVTFLLYRPILGLSFTQDDWFLLRQAKFNSPREQLFASFPNPDSIYFRPLGMQGFFYLVYRLFGLHEWMYRLVTIVIHSSNVVLVFSLSSLVFSSVTSSLSISTLYLLSPLHFASLGWLANVSFVSGACFTLLALKAGIQGKRTLATGFFVIGLLVNELVITTPLSLLLLLIGMKTYRKWKRTAFAMMTISTLYIVFRFISSRAASGSYELTFDPRVVIQNIRWLFLWSLGWPETVRDHFVSLFSIRKEFVETFPFETSVFSITTASSLALMIRGTVRNPKVASGFLWFLVAFSPIAFFRSHIFPHYAMIGSVGLYFLIVSGLRRLSRPLQLIFFVFWIAQSLLAFRVNRITHWWVQHATLSASLIDQVDVKDPILLSFPNTKVIVLNTPDPEQAKIVLAGDSAMQVLYNDPYVKTEFVKEESGHPGAETR